MKKQIFFYCNAIPDDLRSHRHIVGDSPAATRKIIGFCKACRSVGIDAQIVSMGRGKIGKSGFFGPHKTECHGIPTYVGPMLHVPIISYLFSALWIAWTAFKLRDAKAKQIHLFYNPLVFYIPALLVLRLLRATPSLDIEDAPIGKAVDMKAWWRAPSLTHISAWISARLAPGGALVASEAIATSMKLNRTLPYYGSVSDQTVKDKPVASVLKVLMSGTLEVATGTKLLTDTLRLLDKSENSNRFHFIITGQGPEQREILTTIESLNSLKVEFFGRVPNDVYRDILESSNIGLSLKLIGSDYSETTFPSKTIEYAEAGLLVLSTDISDVRKLFESNALYLLDNDPHQLCDLLINLSNDFDVVHKMGDRSQRMIKYKLSRTASGEKINAFFFASE